MNKPFAIPTFFSQALLLAIFGGTAGCSPSSTETASPLSVAPAKSAPARQAFRRALMRYDDIRARLAQDQTQGIPESAQAFRSDIEQVVATEHPYPAALLQEAGARAAKLVEQKDIAKLRLSFGALSDVVVAIAKTDDDVQAEWHLFSCPMAAGFPEWMQREPKLQNPHMGQAMLACGEEKSWHDTAPPALQLVPDAKTAGLSGVAFHTCPMHPSIQQPEPGQCPLCGMDLVAVSQEEQRSGVLFVDPTRRQRIGIRSQVVKRGPLHRTLRTYGVVVVDESRIYDVTLRFSGYVEALYADETGRAVRKGEPLFTVYSPELYAAQQELLEAQRAADATGTKRLLRAAQTRLRLAGLTERQVNDVLARGRPYERLPIFAPTSGFILEKRVYPGSAVRAGERVFRIAASDQVWVEAELFESDLDGVKVGAEARIEAPSAEHAQATGRVSFLSPTLDERSRTRKVRVELSNSSGIWIPGAAVDVILEQDLGEFLLVPETAVIYTGPRRLVFLDEGSGRLRPEFVRVGPRNDDFIAVLDGVSEGELVVTTGAFLVASESRIRNATQVWATTNADMPPGHMTETTPRDEEPSAHADAGAAASERDPHAAH